MIERPKAEEPERIVVALIIIHGAAALEMIQEELADKDFHNMKYRYLYAACEKLHAKGMSIEAISVAEEIKAMGKSKEVSETFIVETTMNVSTVSSIETYAHYVKAASMRRGLIDVAGKIGIQALDPTVEIEKVVMEAEKSVLEITGVTRGEKPTPISGMVHGVIAQIEEIQRGGREVWGLRSGFGEIDRVMGGYEEETLTVIAGRPGQGKTAFALSSVLTQAANGIPAGLFSIEMSRTQMMLRTLSQMSGIDAWKFKSKGKIGEAEWLQLNEAAGKLSQLPVVVDTSGNLTLPMLKARTRKMVAEFGIKTVYVDYLQIMRAPKADTRDLSIGEITRESKELAKELKIPIILLAQVSRKVEERGDKRPLLGDLRESGNIEQDADNVIFVMRPDSYGHKHINHNGEKIPSAGLGVAILAKHRNGPPGDVLLQYNKGTMLWRDYDEGNKRYFE